MLYEIKATYDSDGRIIETTSHIVAASVTAAIEKWVASRKWNDEKDIDQITKLNDVIIE